MKRNNNKALYEKIMRNISKQLKYTLNESELSINSIDSKVLNNINKFQYITDNFFNQLKEYVKQYPILKKYMKCLDPKIWISPVFETMMGNFKYNKISPNDEIDIVNGWIDIFKSDSDSDDYSLCFELNYDQSNYNFDTEILADFIYKFIDLYNLEDQGNEYEWTSIYISGTINQAFKKLLTIVKNYCNYVIKHIDELL